MDIVGNDVLRIGLISRVWVLRRRRITQRLYKNHRGQTLCFMSEAQATDALHDIGGFRWQKRIGPNNYTVDQVLVGEIEEGAFILEGIEMSTADLS